MRSPIQTRRHQHGFSLIELSIALAVIGVVVAGGLSMSTSMVDRQAYVQTGNQMDEIEKAIAAYVAVNNRLPCPADPAPAMGGIGFGVEVANCSALDPMSPPGDLVAANGTGGRQTWIGTLPVRTLGLRDRFIADEYGNRYTYAVTSAMTTTAGYENSPPVVANNGAITLQDGNGALIVDDAAYTVVSHGGDSKGAYRFESASNTVACAGGLDAENCDGDAVFRDARFNRGSVAANYFDDTTRFARREIINMVSAGADVAKQQLWLENGTHIYNSNTGNVGVGTNLPLTKLEVENTAAAGTESNLVTLDSNNTGNGAGAQISFRNSSEGIYASLFANRDGLGNRYIGMRTRTGAGVNDTPLDYSHDAFSVSSNGQARLKRYLLRDTTLRNGSFGEFIINNVPAAGNTLRAINIDFDNTSGNISAGTPIGIDMQLRHALSKGIRGYIRNVDSIGIDLISTNYNTDATFFKAASINGTRITGIDIEVDGENSTAAKFVGFSNGGATTTALSAYHNNYGVLTGCTIGTNTHAMNCTGNVAVTGNITATGTITPSDERLKKDIIALEEKDGLAAIKALRPVYYSWKDEAQTNREIGFIAQEVEKIFPNLVTEFNKNADDKTSYKGVDYQKLTAPIVRAIQQLADALDDVAKDVSELLAKVSGHDAKIKALEAENASLKLRLDAIEKKLAE